MKKMKKKVLGPAYSSYHGKVRIPFVSPYTPVSLGDGIYLDSGCPGHAVFGNPKSDKGKDMDEIV